MNKITLLIMIMDYSYYIFKRYIVPLNRFKGHTEGKFQAT